MSALSEDGTNPQSASMMKDSRNRFSGTRSPPRVARSSSYDAKLTKTLLVKHDAYQEIDEEDEQAQASFNRLNEKTYWCSWSYNLR